MFDVVTFGEAMIRFTPPSFQRLEQARSMDVHIGGAELNVAVGISRLGLRSAWVSRLPRNPLGALIYNGAKEAGVDCSYVIWSEDGRAGLYFLEMGASPRPSRVIYDRENSAISRIRRGEVPWEEIFQGSRHFHVTGITPALSRTACEVTWEAISKAREMGRSISFDINYRAKLWSPNEARETLEPMLSHVDILITNEGDPRVVLGLRESGPEELAGRLSDLYGIETVIITLKRGKGMWRCRWGAIALSGGELLTDREYDVEIVDRLGAGDAFAAGFLAGWLQCGDIKKGLSYGNAFAAIQHTTPGDFNWSTREEVEELLQGAEPRIRR
jgi:2-dehydro-3-deoxygluconokinase